MVSLYSCKIFRRFLSISMEHIKTIGTHNGVFHCDEVLGCSMLKLICPGAEIIRTRDDEQLSKCDIVIDVGGVYDLNKLRLDHHQKTFEHSMSTLIPGKTWSIKLSSAGLVYCHFGKDVIRALVKDIKNEDLEKIYDMVYENFIQEIDAIDNGIPICEGVVKYNISTHLSVRVKNLNKRWNNDDFDEEKAFHHAMDLVLKEFKDKIYYYIQDWLPAREIVMETVQNRFNVHSSGEVMELSKNCPWKGHFFGIEKELNLQPEVKYIIFNNGPTWRVQAVPIDEHSFILRFPLLESWRGLRDEELFKISGIDGIVFVHSNGFIGGNKTRDGALEMAIRSLTLSRKDG